MEKNINTKTIQTSNTKSSIFWLIGVFVITICLLLFCQLYFGDTVNNNTTFYQNTSVNGIDISGLTKEEANSLLTANLVENKNKINITLKHENKEWTLNGEDFEIIGNFNDSLNNVINVGRDGNIFQKKSFENKIKKEGLIVNVPYQDLLGGIEFKINDIIEEIEKQPSAPYVTFNPNSETMFSVNNLTKGYIVDRDLLDQKINLAIQDQDYSIIEIPTKEIIPENSLEEFVQNISLRSSFTTNYSKSTSNRKTNIKLALKSFNGLIVEPGQEISFNNQTGPRTSSNGYKNANIIFDGSYVSGVGGGVCQASTTLYNALILSDIEILQVTHHSLPASYVPLSFDSMVSDGYADLIFKNNLETPIFIKTICTDDEITVEIYGQPFEDGLKIETRAELVKILPHEGDSIISDTTQKYLNQVIYKGEYYRLKYPQEGYESKGYIQYIKDGIVIEEKLIRHDHYRPQKGIIIEGTCDPEEGMIIPSNNIKIIPPQIVTDKTIENAKKKWKIID